MFLNDLYNILNFNCLEDELISEIRLNASHRLYQGHFPGMPVTPGVVQLQIAKELLEQHLHKNIRLDTLRTCKFLHILNPVENPRIQIHIKWRISETIEVTASAESGETIFFKVQATYL
ncbi:3-hydroxyacyl-ACP dehydratase [Dyadobacter sediminis]|uniref:3-hydroxyacyl-ACP dehydratase n=1 Tax=Dyadobacter sediminis TaxID=1493691 RepID=A0A5R9KKV5_9BACT|nr:3-hydroxyacyl-ACP dehydratase [Dyadobacter sediminis]TLU96824.1 3-hydroxyacyl-ACP dehydratase [Dyadobacter sediminis]GGB85448.1 3-hydroxyacyl-ACP dehydratase [Dyadobacter sediminis]